MADSENIGGIDVTIGADYSDLKADFASAQSDSQAAGSAIADAFNSTAATGVDALTEALGQLTGALGGLSGQVEDLSSAMGDYSGAATKAGESSEEAEGGLKAMAEQMAAVGEALVITEGMRELGTEALGAADNLTHATIALTTITGSGDQAKETIESLDQLGQSDGLAMPSLLSAATRMQAILGPSTDVNEQLKLVADGAAVMGTDIETATTKFDQMATAGTASARTLTSLGISLSSLATAYNSVIEGSDETASSVAASFKALDQSQRIDVLDAALKTLGGTAEQVANQTFGGQWQQLANEWEGVMVQVGQAILPVVSDLIQFTKTDIVPFLQDAIGGFNSLSPAVKDTVVALTLAVAAIVPVTGALAAMGLAVSGLEGLVPAITGLMGSLGLATGAAGEAAAGAAESVGTAGLGGSLVALVPVAATAGIAFLEFKGQTGDLKDAVTGLFGTLGQLVTAMAKAGESAITTSGLWQTASTAISSLASSISAQFQQMGRDTITYTEQLNALIQTVFGITPGLDGAAQGLKNFQVSATTTQAAVDALTASFKAAKESVVDTSGPIKTALDAIAKSAGDNATALKAAQTEYQMLTASFASGMPMINGVVATLPMVNIGLADLKKAAGDAGTSLEQLGVVVAPIPGTMDAINQAALKLGPSTTTLAGAQQLAADAATAQQANLFLLNTTLDTAQAKVMLLTTQYRDSQAAQDGSITKTQELQTAEKNLIDAEVALAAAHLKMTTAQDDARASAAILASGIGTVGANLAVLQNDLSGAQAKLQDQIDLMNVGQGSAAKYATALKQVQTAQENLDVATAVAATGLQGNTAQWAILEQELVAAKAKLSDVTTAYKDGTDSAQQYASAQTGVLNAQIAADQQTAIYATGLANNTDQISLLTTQVAAAQAKVNDLTTAVQNGLPYQAQLLSAEQSLTSAQKALNDAVAASVSPLTASKNAVNDLATAGRSAITVMGDLGQQMGDVGNAAAAAGAQIQAAAADLDNFIELSNSMTGTTAGASGLGGGKTYYAEGQAPYYTGAAAGLNSQFGTSDLVKPGTTMSQSELDALSAQLDQIANSSGLTGTALTQLTEKVFQYYAAPLHGSHPGRYYSGGQYASRWLSPVSASSYFDFRDNHQRHHDIDGHFGDRWSTRHVVLRRQLPRRCRRTKRPERFGW